MKIFAISDIHGCYDELMALFNSLPMHPEIDTMVFLGDYIDRGPDSKKVIQQLIDWKEQYPHWVMLKGNHEHMMLDALVYNGIVYHSYDLWYTQGGKETHYSYLPDTLTAYKKAITKPEDFIPIEHLTFLASLPVFHETDDYIFVHGGCVPGEHPSESKQYDLMWIRDDFIKSNYDWGKKVIFGHTCADDFQPIVMANKIGIDTGVCPGRNNKLTCVELPAEKFYFEPSHRRV